MKTHTDRQTQAGSHMLTDRLTDKTRTDKETRHRKTTTDTRTHRFIQTTGETEYQVKASK